MNREQVGRIERAIREHTRAMVAATLATSPLGPGESWASDEAQMEWAHKYADALLAVLSASSGGENDAASGGDVASGVSTRSQDVSGHREPAVAPEVNPSETQAATPPLSADLVTVRRDDLAWVVAVLSIHGECTTRWNRLRDVVSR